MFIQRIKGWQKEFEFSYLIKFMGARNKIYKQEKEREILKSLKKYPGQVADT